MTEPTVINVTDLPVKRGVMAKFRKGVGWTAAAVATLLVGDALFTQLAKKKQVKVVVEDQPES